MNLLYRYVFLSQVNNTNHVVNHVYNVYMYIVYLYPFICNVCIRIIFNVNPYGNVIFQRNI